MWANTSVRVGDGAIDERFAHEADVREQSFAVVLATMAEPLLDGDERRRSAGCALGAVELAPHQNVPQHDGEVEDALLHQLRSLVDRAPRTGAPRERRLREASVRLRPVRDQLQR